MKQWLPCENYNLNNISKILLVYFALKSVSVLLRIIRWWCSLFRMIIDFTNLDFHYSSSQITKVLNFLNRISEKTSYFNLVKVLFYFCHIPRVSLILKRKIPRPFWLYAVLNQHNYNPFILLKVRGLLWNCQLILFNINM